LNFYRDYFQVLVFYHQLIFDKFFEAAASCFAWFAAGDIKYKLEKKIPPKIQSESNCNVEPEPEKESISLDEKNCDFWWDAVSMDLSFKPKSEMIDSGISEPELEFELKEEKTMLEQKGSDVTILTSSETIDLAIKAAGVIRKRHSYECDIIRLGKMDSSGSSSIIKMSKFFCFSNGNDTCIAEEN